MLVPANPLVGGTYAVARVVEVWVSGEDARAFAERSAPAVAEMPAPSRVVGFDVTSYLASHLAS